MATTTLPSTMKQAIINPDLTVTIEHYAPVPKPSKDEIIVKAVFAGVNPIDWKGAHEKYGVALHGVLKSPVHRAPGKDFVGLVVGVGKSVYGFRVGDRVMCVNHSSGFAEYSVGKTFASAHIPEEVSFEDALSFGLPYLTANLLAFKSKLLPTPWNPAPRGAQIPFIVYGASSSLGAYVVKLAKLANIHPIVAIAGGSAELIEPTLDKSKGDILIDYRQPELDLINTVRSAVPSAHFVADAIGTPKTGELCAKLVDPNNSFVTSSVGEPWDETLEDRVPKGVKLGIAFAPGVFEPNDLDGPDGEDSVNLGPKALSITAMGYLSFGLKMGILEPHPWDVRGGGMGALEESLQIVKEGRNRGKRFLLRVGDWKGE